MFSMFRLYKGSSLKPSTVLQRPKKNEKSCRSFGAAGPHAAGVGQHNLDGKSGKPIRSAAG